MAIAVLNVIEATDKYAAAYLAAKGTSGSGYGMGDKSLARASDFGLSGKLRVQGNNVKNSTNWTDEAVSARQINALNAAAQAADFAALLPGIFRSLLAALDTDCAAAGISGVSSLAQFLTYYNYGGGGPFAALACPDFATLYQLVQSSPLSPLCVYSPAIANMGSLAFGGSYSDGTAVDTTKYAGAALPQVTMATIAGSGVVVVAGNGFNGLGTGVPATGPALFTGHTWRATVSGNTTYALVPDTPGDILTDVTGISLAAGITGGTATVGCIIPSASGAYSYFAALTRTNPPT